MAKQKIYTVKGKISDKENRPLQGLTVRAFDLDPDTADNLLGNPVQTDAQGTYKITYTDADFRLGGRESGGADVVLRVYDRAGTLLGESPLRKNAGTTVTINLAIDYADPAGQEYAFLFHPDVLAKSIAELIAEPSTLPPAERAAVKRIANAGLADAFLRLAGDQRAKLEPVLAHAEVDFEYGPDKNLLDYFNEFVAPEAKKLKLADAGIDALRNAIQSAPANTVAATVGVEAPLKDNPLIAKVFREVQAREFGKLIGLNADKIDRLVEQDINWEDVTGFSLREIDGLTDAEIKGLVFASDLTRLTGNNLPLIKVLKTLDLNSVADLVPLDTAGWVRLMTEKNIRAPQAEKSLETYAGRMRRNVEATYPNLYFFYRIVQKEHRETFQLLDTVERLKAKNPVILPGASVDPAALDWTGIGESDRQQMENDLQALSAFANSYRHLGLRDVVNDAGLNRTQKQDALSSSLNALKRFQENNPKLDLYRTNIMGQRQDFNWENIPEAKQAGVLKQMMAYQRVQVLTNDFATGERLLSKGLDSALTIANLSLRDFAQRSGLSYADSKLIYERAQSKASAVIHAVEVLRDARFGTFKELNVSNLYPVSGPLVELDGYSDFFGTQNYCACAHCRSILSPAAYFTDLMYFVQKNISDKLPAEHPILLKTRRPDLWTLPLTCANTNTEIPYLQVVNEVLETYIRTSQQTDDVYKLLNEANVSVTLPVSMPLEELRLYIAHFQPLFEVYKKMKQSRKVLLKEKLGLSEHEPGIIATPDTAGVLRRFGNETLTGMEVQRFLKYARISRSELTDLLQTRFTAEISKVKVQLLQDPDDIQQYTEVLQDLTDTRLDLIHRYLRLWKKTDWTMREFDLLLHSLKAAGLMDNLEALDQEGDPRFLLLGELAIIQDALRCKAEELPALFGPIPKVAVRENQKSLLERLFDLEKLFGLNPVGEDWKYNLTVNLPADKAQDRVTPLILAGLSITESELGALFQLLGVDTAQDMSVDYDFLAKLFRHVRIARGLKWTVEELLGAVRLVLGNAPLSQIDQVQTLTEFKQWLQQSPLKIADLLFILYGQETTARRFEHGNADSAAAVWGILNAPEPDKIPLLKVFLQQEFNLTATQLEDEFLRRLVAIDLEGPGIENALNAAFTGEQPNKLEDFVELTALLRVLERLGLLFEKLDFSPEDISFFVAHPEVFGIVNLKNLTLPDIRSADIYPSITQNTGQKEAIAESLIQYQTDGNFAGNSLALWATIWKQPLSQIQSLAGNFTFSTNALEAVQFLRDLNSLSGTLGLEGHNLAKLRASTYLQFVAARDVVLSAFTAKYPDETTRLEKLEPYTDKINTFKRDALCDYIIGSQAPPEFTDRSDLYEYFLLDVEMSGCFRTSRVVAAITSLQLYVHRVLTNLEQTAPGVDPAISVLRRMSNLERFRNQWEWRKNYRVWEANRKVFLYPENWIDPTLRDNKTHLFRDLEDELLQEKITLESAEAAYKKYLAQFNELAKLRYAGAYYHSNTVERPSVKVGSQQGNNMYFVANTSNSLFQEIWASIYFLFARTNVDPYQYYYRTYTPSQKAWGNWIKMEVAIEADEISAIINRGRLYLFWNEVQRKEINKISGGDATSSEVVFKVYTKYSFFKESGNWSPPQRIYIGYMYSNEKLVFERILGFGKYPSIQEQRDKRHDFVFEQFEKKVFRKPYVIADLPDKVTPLQLSCIWSQNMGMPTGKYYFLENTHHLGYQKIINPQGDVVNLKKLVWIPSTVFIIYDQFKPQEKSQPAILMINSGNNRVGELHTTARIILVSASSCIIHIEGQVSVYNDWVQISINSDFSPPLKTEIYSTSINASHFDLSISENKILNFTSEDITANDIDINLQSANFLKDEFETAYAEDGTFAHYIENGYKSFTSTWRKIFQNQAGDGQLSIEGRNGIYPYLNIIPTSTILTDELSDILAYQGLTQFLSLNTQTLTDTSGRQFDLKGPYGNYYWELFFHIPFLIANHLNADQKFKEAKWWYERIFDPTATETPADQTPADRVWRFREFRGLDMEKLKDILLDDAAIAAYKDDPFNPHAIARLRISAYQKAIVMKYIDNLIDWGDYLFAQDTRESINEAFMLYQLAYDILGERPVQLGDCETADENAITYEGIEPLIEEGSEFLIGLENTRITDQQDHEDSEIPLVESKHLAGFMQNLNLVAAPNSIAQVADAASRGRVTDAAIPPVGGAGETPAVVNAVTINSGIRVAKFADFVAQTEIPAGQIQEWIDLDEIPLDDYADEQPDLDPAMDIVTQGMLVYCVPHNAELLAYWDRVEDRMYKIRHCMNISGIRRSLALFQPPIDPGLLVRARALGLSLEDVYNLITSPFAIPLYRFEYLIEKARQYTQTVQSFGNALLSALERKDVEELTLLRSVQEQNIMKLTKENKRNQIKEAQHQYKSTEEAMKNVQNRIEYYQKLLETPRNLGEMTQMITKHAANATTNVGAICLALSAGFSAGPQIVGFSFSTPLFSFSKTTEMQGLSFQGIANALHGIADSAGFEASFRRRGEEWEQQLTLAKQEMVQVEQQLLAAEVRHNITEKDLEIHEKTIEQAEEAHRFYKDKFTNLGLYNFLSTNLSRLYRRAYQMALEMARQAEQAYRFERSMESDEPILIGADYFDTTRAGLLAGDRLLIELQALESRFLETNERLPEIVQSFSLMQIDPAALLTLKQEGSCTFDIPELFFDLYYPGHYGRKIKAVQLTIPCITGPFTNVSATLTLTGSRIRVAPNLEEDALIDVPLSRTNSIATSRAQNDAGVFQLNFQDARYLPFEGAGAISSWKLSLPKNFRQFAYGSISDVIIQVSYTAKFNGNLKTQVEGENEEAESAIFEYLNNPENALPRIFSLKHDFSSEFHRLLRNPVNQPVTIDISHKHFPFFLNGRDVRITKAVLLLDTPAEQSVTNFEVQINGVSQSGFNKDSVFGNVWAKDLGNLFNSGILKEHTIRIVNAGDLASDSPVPDNMPAIDQSKLEGMLLYVEYRMIS